MLTGPEAEAEMERKLLIEEAKALKKRKELEEMQFNEFQQEKVTWIGEAHMPRPDWRVAVGCVSLRRQCVFAVQNTCLFRCGCWGSESRACDGTRRS